MRNLITVLALLLSVSAITVSCKEHKHTDGESHYESHAAEKADLAMNEVFQCPMDCEDGKTYDEEGSCPVCKMDLKKVEKDTTSENEAHDHDNNEDHEH